MIPGSSSELIVNDIKKKERNEIIWILAMAPRKATVRALFLSLILVWITMLITEELSTVSAIFLPLYYSLLSLKNYQLLLTIAQNEPKRLLLVFSLSFKIGKLI